MAWWKNSRTLEIFTEEDLEARAANDDYWHNKGVDDAIYRVTAWAIYGVGVLAIMAVGYFVYYYAWGPNKNPSVLVQAASGIVLYVSGIVTPTIKSTLRKRRSVKR